MDYLVFSDDLLVAYLVFDLQVASASWQYFMPRTSKVPRILGSTITT